MRSIRDADVREKKVFLRVDFNVPLENRKVLDNNRISQAIPTIKFLLEKKAKIIIGTHIGRPEGKYNPEFTTVPIAKELARLLGQDVEVTDHIISPLVTEKVDQMKPGQILMLGNLRFSPEEEKNSQSFGQALAQYVDVYVNDAFAVSHRANASVDSITNFLPSYSGFLLELEITSLDLLLNDPAHPFVLVIGGAKVRDKAGLLTKLAEKADSVLIGGVVANTFLKAKGEETGASLVDTEMIDECKKIIEKFGDKINLPKDLEKEVKADGSFKALDIGTKTRSEYSRKIDQAQCIFWNGNMGYTENPKFCEGTRVIAQAMVDNIGTKVIAGGDTVGFVDQNEMRDGFSFISTGGGAAMQYLAGESLPGIEALERSFKGE